MPIQLAVFDMAGTTVYDNDHVAKAFQTAFSSFGFDIVSVNINHLMGFKKTQAIKSVLDQLDADYDDQLISDIHAEFVRHMLHHYRYDDGVRALPYAEETFQKLRENRVKIALNTGFSRDIATVIIERLGWKNVVDEYIGSTEVEQGRPSPQMINELMRRMGITSAGEVLKVGDTQVDIDEGRNAGCGLVVAVTTGAYSRSELAASEPDFILNDLSELLSIIKDFE